MCRCAVCGRVARGEDVAWSQLVLRCAPAQATLWLCSTCQDHQPVDDLLAWACYGVQEAWRNAFAVTEAETGR